MYLQNYGFEGCSLQPTYSTGQPIRVGDWVRVFLPRLGVWHDGIVHSMSFVGNGFAVRLANNVKGVGITTSDWYEFAEGQIIHLHRRPTSGAQVREILARVEKSVGKPYHLVAQNCQHFASYAFTGKAESPYVQTVGLIAVVIAAVKFLS